MSNPWSMLTARGKTFSLVGLGVGVAAVVLGQRDLVWFGIFLFVLPLVALAVVARSKLRLTCERRVMPPQVVVGERLSGELTITKVGNLPTGMLLFEDEVPRGLGRRPRFSVHRFAGEWRRDITYPMLAVQRGRYVTGPLAVRASDPFNLVKLDRRFSGTSDVLVTPRIVPLPVMRTAAGAGSSGDSTPQRVGVVGQDDILVREYRSGDDVRRIHWRSTARRGEIMVRREEQAWEPAATVILDNRGRCHAGGGKESSFEWAVSAAASIALHFLGANFRVELFDADGPMVTTERRVQSPATRQQIIHAMTDVTTSRQANLKRIVEATEFSHRGQLLIAVTGRLTSGDVERLVAVQHDRALCLAVVVDPDTFVPRAERSSEDAYDAHREAIDALRHQRWRVVEAGQGTDLLAVWADLDKMGEVVNA